MTEGKKDETTAKPRDPSTHDINAEQFGEYLLELLQTDALVTQFRKYLHDPRGNDPAGGRSALTQILSEITRPAFNDAVRPTFTSLSRLEKAVAELQKSLDEANARLNFAVSDRIDIETILRSESEAKTRYLTEFRAEKRAIAQHIVRHYFSRQVHCFVQASTTAFHIADELQVWPQAKGSVIHTNSFALPYLVLSHLNRHALSVYPIAGQVKDLKCCGWLYSSVDNEADGYLRSVFNRPLAAADCAFITPQFMDDEGTLYFAREETVNLVQTIFECSRKIIVLSPGPRVLSSRDELPSIRDVPWFDITLPSTLDAEHVDWVVTSNLPKLTPERRALLEQNLRRNRPGTVTIIETPAGPTS